MTPFAVLAIAVTLFLSEPMPPNCGQLRPEITHSFGEPWVVAAPPDDDGAPGIKFWVVDNALGQADRVQQELCERTKQ